MHLNEAFFQSELNKMLDDSWVIVGDLETMESQCDHVVGGDCEGQVGEWSGQRWCKFTGGGGEENVETEESEINGIKKTWNGDTWRKYV